MKRTTLLLVLSIIIFACNQKKASQATKNEGRPATSDSLTTALDEIYKDGHIKGFSVGIVNADSVLYQRGFGFMHQEDSIPYSVHSIQNIASVSKTLIGIALLKAQEMELLKLDDPINAHLPFEVHNPYFPSEAITIRQLATHTATIADTELYGRKAYILYDDADYETVQSIPSAQEFNRTEAAMDLQSFLQNFLSVEGSWYQKESFLNKKPGSFYEYSNVGATLAAYIVEHVSGQSYREFTKKHILEPLEMNSSGWTFDEIDMSKHTKLYDLDGKVIPHYNLVTYPDGGLLTTMDNMTIYLGELIKGYSGQGTLLSKSSYEQLFTPLLTEDHYEERDTDRDFDDEYNSGIFMGYTPTAYIGHTGGDPGVSTFMFFDPQTKIGKLLFINTDLDQEGAQQFFRIWETLGVYEAKLD